MQKDNNQLDFNDPLTALVLGSIFSRVKELGVDKLGIEGAEVGKGYIKTPVGSEPKANILELSEAERLKKSGYGDYLLKKEQTKTPETFRPDRRGSQAGSYSPLTELERSGQIEMGGATGTSIKPTPESMLRIKRGEPEFTGSVVEKPRATPTLMDDDFFLSLRKEKQPIFERLQNILHYHRYDPSSNPSTRASDLIDLPEVKVVSTNTKEGYKNIMLKDPYGIEKPIFDKYYYRNFSYDKEAKYEEELASKRKQLKSIIDETITELNKKGIDLKNYLDTGFNPNDVPVEKRQEFRKLSRRVEELSNHLDTNVVDKFIKQQGLFGFVPARTSEDPKWKSSSGYVEPKSLGNTVLSPEEIKEFEKTKQIISGEGQGAQTKTAPRSKELKKHMDKRELPSRRDFIPEETPYFLNMKDEEFEAWKKMETRKNEALSKIDKKLYEGKYPENKYLKNLNRIMRAIGRRGK